MGKLDELSLVGRVGVASPIRPSCHHPGVCGVLLPTICCQSLPVPALVSSTLSRALHRSVSIPGGFSRVATFSHPNKENSNATLDTNNGKQALEGDSQISSEL